MGLIDWLVNLEQIKRSAYQGLAGKKLAGQFVGCEAASGDQRSSKACFSKASFCDAELCL